MNQERVVLGSAAFFIAAIGVAYLVAPAVMLAVPGITIKTINEAHLVRAAYGGAFISFGVLFALGAAKPAWSQTALVALITFMGGFAFGRVVSMLVDGMPSPLFKAVFVGELLYAAIALYFLSTSSPRS